MNFEFKDNIKLNKSFILSRITEEQIMAFYLRVPLDRKKLFCSPLRSDKSVTCAVFRSNKGTLLFKDFATGEAINCFEVVKKLYNCDYHQALKIIANDFNLIKDPSLVKNKGLKINESTKIEDKEMSKVQVEIQDFTELELKWWKKYGITLDTLKKFNVYSCKHVFLNGQLVASSQQHCPIFGYYGGKYHGMELWKIYFPKRTSFRFIGNYPAKKLQGYEQLPKKGKVCVITKSMKDCLTLYSLGIPACAPNSETVIPSEAIVDDLTSRFEHVFCLWDNDHTGITFLNKIKRKYPKLHCLIIPRKYGYKDISDMYKGLGKNKTLNLIKEFLIWLKEKKSSQILAQK